jgi:hypothetical protein
MKAVGDDPKKVIHEGNEKKKDIQTKTDGNRRRQPGNKYLPDFLSHL